MQLGANVPRNADTSTATIYTYRLTYTLVVCVYAYVQICSYVYLHVYVHVVICMRIRYTWFRISCVWDESSFLNIRYSKTLLSLYIHTIDS